MDGTDRRRETRKIEFAGTKKHMKVGLSLFRNGDYEGAIEQFELILLHDKTYVRAYNNLGYAYRTLGNYEKALAVWEEGLRIDPSYRRLSKNIAGLRKRLKSAEEKKGPLPIGVEDFEAEIEWISENAELIELKEGRFSDVYLLEDGAARYALKTPKSPFADRSEILKAFEEACSGWVGLDNSEYVTKASSVELVAGRPFLALEAAPYGSLREFLDKPSAESASGKRSSAGGAGRAGLSLGQMLDFALQACMGLHFIYSRFGVVHGDIRPENFLLWRMSAASSEEESRIGRTRCSLKVSDIGLLKTFADHTLYCDDAGRLLPQFSNAGLFRTPAGFLTFSVASCAPELLESVREPCILTDIYAFGVMLYEIFTGALPFSHFRSTDILNEMKNRPKHPSAMNPRIPPAVGDIAMRCLERNPRERFGDFMQIAETLISWLEKNEAALRQLEDICRPYKKISTYQFRNEEGKTSVMIVGGTEFYSETDQIWEILKRRAKDERDTSLQTRIDSLEKTLLVPGLSIGRMYPTPAGIHDIMTGLRPRDYRDRLAALKRDERESPIVTGGDLSLEIDHEAEKAIGGADGGLTMIFGPDISTKYASLVEESRHEAAARLLADAMKLRARSILSKSPNRDKLLVPFEKLEQSEQFPVWLVAIMEEISSRSTCPAPARFLEEGMNTPPEMIAAVCGLLFMLGGEFAPALEIFNMIPEERYLPAFDIYIWSLAKFQSQKMEEIRLNSLKNAARILKEVIISAKDDAKQSAVICTSEPDIALADAFYLRGLVLDQLGDHGHAVGHFRACKKILREKTNWARKKEAWADLAQGKCMYDLGMPSEGLMRWQRTLTHELGPPFFASAELGVYAPRTLIALQSLQCCEKAISRFTDNAVLWALKGKLLNCAGMGADAAECASRALSLDEGYYPAHFVRMEAMLALGRHEEALDAVRVCSLREPHDPLLMLKEAEILCRLGESEKALVELKRAIGHALDMSELSASAKQKRLALLEEYEDFRSIMDHIRTL